MINRPGRLGSAALIAVAASLLMAVSGAAGAKKPHQKCSLTASKLAAHLTFPCDGATVPAGHKITFKVFDGNSKARLYRPFIELTKRAPNRKGHLPRDPLAGGFFDQMAPVKGRADQFVFTPHQYTFPGWWDVTPGKYYIQVQQVDARAGIGATFYSPVESIIVK
jgi:hypothetical protein